MIVDLEMNVADSASNSQNFLGKSAGSGKRLHVIFILFVLCGCSMGSQTRRRLGHFVAGQQVWILGIPIPFEVERCEGDMVCISSGDIQKHTVPRGFVVATKPVPEPTDFGRSLRTLVSSLTTLSVEDFRDLIEATKRLGLHPKGRCVAYSIIGAMWMRSIGFKDARPLYTCFRLRNPSPEIEWKWHCVVYANAKIYDLKPICGTFQGKSLWIYPDIHSDGIYHTNYRYLALEPEKLDESVIEALDFRNRKACLARIGIEAGRISEKKREFANLSKLGLPAPNPPIHHLQVFEMNESPSRKRSSGILEQTNPQEPKRKRLSVTN